MAANSDTKTFKELFRQVIKEAADEVINEIGQRVPKSHKTKKAKLKPRGNPQLAALVRKYKSFNYTPTQAYHAAADDLGIPDHLRKIKREINSTPNVVNNKSSVVQAALSALKQKEATAYDKFLAGEDSPVSTEESKPAILPEAVEKVSYAGLEGMKNDPSLHDPTDRKLDDFFDD